MLQNVVHNSFSHILVSYFRPLQNYNLSVQVSEFQQRKCTAMFDYSCNLARVLEFCTHEIPQAFLSGADTNLRRLIELIVFILNHITSVAEAEFFDL